MYGLIQCLFLVFCILFSIDTRYFHFHFLHSFVLYFDQTYSTFGNWRCPLHLMNQQVSIASSEALNDIKLFQFHLLCVAILKSDTLLSLIFLPLKPIYFQWAEGYLVSQFFLLPSTMVSMGPICAYYKCAALFRTAASL